MKAIGIDIGTTSVCGVVIDTESGRLLCSRTVNSDAFLCGSAEWEKIQSVDKIISVATQMLDSFIEADVAAIGVTGQMHGIVYVNAAGRAVSPLYTWQDERGNLAYKGTTYARYLNCFSGYGNVTDFYNRENGIRPREAVSYCTVHDYFVMQLCSLRHPVMHSSDAASFGCYDILSNKFSYDCNADVVSDYYVAGEYKGIPVGVAIGDNQASVFSTLTNENDLLLNVGTGSQVSVISDAPIVGDDIETRPYFENKYLVVGSALCGGRAYSMLKSFYSEILGYEKETDDELVYGIMSKMLRGLDKSALNVDTRFAGTRKNAELCGSITGIRAESFTPSHLTLGVLDGIADELHGMYRQMGVQKQGIVGSGNGLRKNPALVRVFEEKFGSEMKMPAHLEEAAFGAALFALVARGKFKDAKEAQRLVD